MNIEALRQIDNKTIAQQNELMFLEMKNCAEQASSISWLGTLLDGQGQTPDAGILILLSSIPDKAGTLWYGTWLAIDKTFYEFVVATSHTGEMAVESWQSVTPEVSADRSGIGKTPAYIAIELLTAIR